MAAMAGGRVVRSGIVWVAAFFVVLAAADPVGDKKVLEAFKAGITNSAGLGWTDPDPCAWNAKMVKCDSAGNVVQLRVRQLGLTGEVTPDLNKLSSLQYLELNYNAFTGAMPSLAGLSQLQYAFLDDNDFTSIPAGCFDGLTAIVELHVENNCNLNKASGGWSIPASLQHATTLSVLSVTNASVSGALPEFLGAMPALKTLEASYNSLVGGVPESFRSSNIQVLKLNNQGMNGSIEPVGGMLSLQILWVQVNKFYGPVPVGLDSAAGLTSLRINDNSLVGRLPLGLANLPALTESLMMHNHLTGELPAFKSSVTTNYDPASFCGGGGVGCSTAVSSLLDFLASVGYPQQVATSWVGSNPCASSWIGVACDPASGEIVSIILQSCGLTGTISPSLANLTSLRSLVLSKNALTGSVPSELAKLPSLRNVDVSSNNLTGPLPLFPSSVLFNYFGNPLIVATPAAPPVPTALPVPAVPATPAVPVGGTPPVAKSPAGSPPAVATPPTSMVPATPSVPSPAIGGSTPGTFPPAPDGSIILPGSNGTIAGQRSKFKSGPVPVVGGVLGGTVAVLVAAFLVCFLCKRKQKKVQGLNAISIFPRGDSGSERDLLKVMANSNSSASHQATICSSGAFSGSSSSPARSNDQQVIHLGNYE